MIDDRLPAFVCAPEIVWVKDAGQTILVDQAADCSWLLHGTEAVVWDLLALGSATVPGGDPGHYAFDRVACFLSVLLNLSMPEASQNLLAILQRWEEENIVHATGRNRRG